MQPRNINNKMSMSRSHADALSRFLLGLSILVLCCAAGCGGGPEEGAGGGESAPPKTGVPEPPLIVWTTVDPLETAAKAVEEFINRYNNPLV